MGEIHDPGSESARKKKRGVGEGGGNGNGDGGHLAHADQERLKQLLDALTAPITARALQADREKCIQAGASDYLPKPVEADKLMELIRLWVRA